jgi:hypothetical protein
MGHSAKGMLLASQRKRGIASSDAIDFLGADRVVLAGGTVGSKLIDIRRKANVDD